MIRTFEGDNLVFLISTSRNNILVVQKSSGADTTWHDMPVVLHNVDNEFNALPIVKCKSASVYSTWTCARQPKSEKFRTLNPTLSFFIPTFIPLIPPTVCRHLVHHHQSTLMSLCELRSIRGRDRARSPSKQTLGGRKRLQSDTDEATPKRSKTHDEEEGSNEIEHQPAAATKGKGKKGKNLRWVWLTCMRA